MQITATVTGGYAGLTEKYQVDTFKEVSAKTKALEKIITDIDFLHAPTFVQEELIGADMMPCQIIVSDGGRQHSVSFIEDGSAKSKTWHELLEKIKECAS